MHIVNGIGVKVGHVMALTTAGRSGQVREADGRLALIIVRQCVTAASVCKFVVMCLDSREGWPDLAVHLHR